MPAPVAELTAAALLDALGGVPAVRRIRTTPPLTAAILVAQIEIAVLGSSDEPTLRRTWSQRQGGGATPLLVIADDRATSGAVAVLGPVDPRGAVRVVDTRALHDVLVRIAPLPRLTAVRELAEELTRLDRAGVPGLRVRELLTLHTLDVRLRGDTERWAAATAAVAGIAPAADWQDVLRGLGYTLVRRPVTGYLVTNSEGRRVAVVHPKADYAELSRLDASGRPPEGRLLNDCELEGVHHGILACRARMRLFEVTTSSAGSASTRYVEFDAITLRPDDRPFLALLGPDYLIGGGLARLQQDVVAFGTGLRQRVDETIRQTALPVLARAVGRWARADGQDLADDAVREELERAALTLVFRCLFLLFAESAGHLPMDQRAYRQASLKALVTEAHETAADLGARSTSLWDRLSLLVRAMRTGNPAWGVPAYNGDLFARDGFDGAATLERLEVTDRDMGAVLVGLGLDSESGLGVDYSTLEIGNLGHIYEGLLSLRLSLAQEPLQYEVAGDRYIPAGEGTPVDVEAGDLLWQTNEGGRKGGGVYYTRAELVRHLVTHTVRPAFAEHLETVRVLAQTDPAAATRTLLEFAVLDPACGSAHFLVVVVAELADQLVRFLAATPLPDVRDHLERLRVGSAAAVPIDDAALVRRLVLKHCVFGVDVSRMGAEVAKLSLWLASFVPGLSLAYLGRNVVVGNSLIGVARPEALRSGGPAPRRRRGGGAAKLVVADEISWLDLALTDALREATAAAARVAASDDRNPDEVAASEAADAEARAATAGLDAVFDLWTADAFGVAGAREEVELHGADIIRGAGGRRASDAAAVAAEHAFLHWPTRFPQVFARERPGFDAVVGNPPWDELKIERLAFLTLFRPGLRGHATVATRTAAMDELLQSRPELGARLEAGQRRAALQRTALAAGEYAPMPGDPDLYKFFCQRYAVLLRDGGRLGVVLPRSVLATAGSAGFRDWLFERTTCHRIDALLNSGSWMFDSEPRYTVVLVAAQKAAPSELHTMHVAGTAASLAEWRSQSAGPGVPIHAGALGPNRTVPLLRSAAESILLAKVRTGSPFPLGTAGGWVCFPVGELHETNDRSLWQGAEEGWPLWKGASFDQYSPTGADARLCRMDEATLTKIRKPRPGGDSLAAAHSTLEERRKAVIDSIDHARVVFRGIARATDSRTVIASFTAPRTLLANSAPYLAFVRGDAHAQAACLGVMNSLPFDWQARRFVEINLNFFILEGLVVPDLDEVGFEAVATAAARLSCVDDRFTDLAVATGVECGPLTDEETLRLRAEIDARVAHAWRLDGEDLDTLLADFTPGAVAPHIDPCSAPA